MWNYIIATILITSIGVNSEWTNSKIYGTEHVAFDITCMTPIRQETPDFYKCGEQVTRRGRLLYPFNESLVMLYVPMVERGRDYVDFYTITILDPVIEDTGVYKCVEWGPNWSRITKNSTVSVVVERQPSVLYQVLKLLGINYEFLRG